MPPKTVSSNFKKLNMKQKYKTQRRPGQGSSTSQTFNSYQKRKTFYTNRSKMQNYFQRDQQLQYTIFDEANVRASKVSINDAIISKRFNGNLANFAVAGLSQGDLNQLQNGQFSSSTRHSLNVGITIDEIHVDSVVFSSKQHVSGRDRSNADDHESTSGPSSSAKLSSPNALPSQTTPSRSTNYFPLGHPFLEPSHLEKMLYDHWGYSTFRQGQVETIQAILSGSSALTVIPTGSGKSLCYQLPTLMLPGLCLVVSPLLSLMKDQLEGLPRGVSAAIWSSSTTLDEIALILSRIQGNSLQILFISPEKLLSSLFQRQLLVHLKHSHISFVCIDEVHCLSEWSHGFRPSYLQIYKVINNVLNCNVIVGLTATATQTTILDLTHKLVISPNQVHLYPRMRPNLLLSVCMVPHQSKLTSLQSLLDSDLFREILGTKELMSGKPTPVDQPQSSSPNQRTSPSFRGSIIVYCSTQYQTEQVARGLRLAGHSADFYHAGMNSLQRERVQNQFMNNQTPIIVATIAFGLGVNKTNIRAVIHYNQSRTVENYLQEIGRGGRDGLACYCITLYSALDAIQYHSLHHVDLVDHDSLKEVMIDITRSITKSVRYIRATQDVGMVGIPRLPVGNGVDSTQTIRDRPQLVLPSTPLQINQHNLSKKSSPNANRSSTSSSSHSSRVTNKRKTIDSDSDDDSDGDDDFQLRTHQRRERHKEDADASSLDPTSTTKLAMSNSKKTALLLTALPTLFFPTIQHFFDHPGGNFVPNLSIPTTKPNTHFLFTYVIAPILRTMRQSRAGNLFKPLALQTLDQIQPFPKHPAIATLDDVDDGMDSGLENEDDGGEGIDAILADFQQSTINTTHALDQYSSIDPSMINSAPQLLSAFDTKLIKKARWRDGTISHLYSNNPKFAKYGNNNNRNNNNNNNNDGLSDPSGLGGLGQPEMQYFTSTFTEGDAMRTYSDLTSHLASLTKGLSWGNAPDNSLATYNDSDDPVVQLTKSLDSSSQRKPQQHSTSFATYIMIDSKRYTELDIKPMLVDTIITTLSLLSNLDPDPNNTNTTSSSYQCKCPHKNTQSIPTPVQSSQPFDAIPSTYSLIRITFHSAPLRALYKLHNRYLDAINKADYSNAHHLAQVFAILMEALQQNGQIAYSLSPIPPLHPKMNNLQTIEMNEVDDDESCDETNSGHPLDSKTTQKSTLSYITFPTFSALLLGDTTYIESNTGKYPLDMALAATRFQLHPGKILHLLSQLHGEKLITATPDNQSTCLRINYLPDCFDCLFDAIYNKFKSHHHNLATKLALMTQFLCYSSINSDFYVQKYKSELPKLQADDFSPSSFEPSKLFSPLRFPDDNLDHPSSTSLSAIPTSLSHPTLFSQPTSPAELLPYLRVVPQVEHYNLEDCIDQCRLLRQHFIESYIPPPRVKRKTAGQVLANSGDCREEGEPNNTEAMKEDQQQQDQCDDFQDDSDVDFFDEDAEFLDSDDDIKQQQLEMATRLMKQYEMRLGSKNKKDGIEPLDCWEDSTDGGDGDGDCDAGDWTKDSPSIAFEPPSKTKRVSFADEQRKPPSQPQKKAGHLDFIDSESDSDIFLKNAHHSSFGFDPDDDFNDNAPLVKSKVIKREKKSELDPKEGKRERKQALVEDKPALPTEKRKVPIEQESICPLFPHTKLHTLSYLYFLTPDTFPLLSVLSSYTHSFSPSQIGATFRTLYWNDTIGSNTSNPCLSQVGGQIVNDFEQFVDELVVLKTRIKANNNNTISSNSFIVTEFTKQICLTPNLHPAHQLRANPVMLYSTDQLKLCCQLYQPESDIKSPAQTPTHKQSTTKSPSASTVFNILADPTIPLKDDLLELQISLSSYLTQTHLPVITHHFPHLYTLLSLHQIGFNSPRASILNDDDYYSQLSLHPHQFNHLSANVPPFSTLTVKAIFVYITQLAKQASVPLHLLNLFGSTTENNPSPKSQSQVSTAMGTQILVKPSTPATVLLPVHAIPWRIYIDPSDLIPHQLPQPLTMSTLPIINSDDPSSTAPDDIKTQYRLIKQLSPYEQAMLLKEVHAARQAPPTRLSPAKLTHISHGVNTPCIPRDLFERHTIWKRYRHLNSIVVEELFQRCLATVFGTFYFTRHFFLFAKPEMIRSGLIDDDAKQEGDRIAAKKNRPHIIEFDHGLDGIYHHHNSNHIPSRDLPSTAPPPARSELDQQPPQPQSHRSSSIHDNQLQDPFGDDW